MPRDRAGSFEPRIVRKGQTRLDGFNDRIRAILGTDEFRRVVSRSAWQEFPSSAMLYQVVTSVC